MCCNRIPTFWRCFAFPFLAWLATALSSAAAQPSTTGAPPGRPSASATASDNTILDTLVVTATRTPQGPDTISSTLRLIDAETLRSAPTLTLDGALRSVPGFSLFRRSDSFTANPTAQGVSLRGLGPSGASRSLVLLDGVPLNDPFGGWIAWTKLPREGIGHTEIVPGGGASAWGNAALGGVLHLFTAPMRTVSHNESSTRRSSSGSFSPGSLRFSTSVGEHGTRSGEIAAVLPIGHGAFQILGRAFSTDGFELVAPERRGPIDIPAWSRHRWLTARWKQPVGEKLQLLATARVFEEKRGNGTPYQQNNSREKFASVALAGEPGTQLSWNAVAYAQNQTFASTFSSVNATRSAETPASDQFDVPATAFGASWTGAWQHGGHSRTSFGADARFVRGETREHFTFSNGAFTRLRVAGGKQLVGGLFALHEHSLNDTLRATIGARIDTWGETDGHRRESDRNIDIASRDERYADREGDTFSPSAGVLWTPSRAWRARASAQRAFRRPTLNELYRPFRVGPNITEANTALGTEKVTSAELGIEWRSAGAAERSPLTASLPPTAFLTLGATAFHNDLRDAVGNVTIARGPGTFPLFGTIAAGGVGRQRLNLDRTRVRGVELSAAWTPAREVSIHVDYLYNDATVRRAGIAPDLAGKRIAQVPRHSAAVSARWLARGGITIRPRVRWIGRQFEDDENQLILGEVVVADMSVTRAITGHLELFLTAENVGNARIETGRTSDGLVNIGMPRLVIGGVRGSW